MYACMCNKNKNINNRKPKILAKNESYALFLILSNLNKHFLIFIPFFVVIIVVVFFFFFLRNENNTYSNYSRHHREISKII